MPRSSRVRTSTIDLFATLTKTTEYKALDRGQQRTVWAVYSAYGIRAARSYVQATYRGVSPCIGTSTDDIVHHCAAALLA